MELKKLPLFLLLSLLLFSSKIVLCEVKEEFHKTYPLAENGRISLDNLNGNVFVNAWDQKEIKLDAIKTAKTNEGLARARIEINVKENSIEIETRYPRQYDWDENDAASVEYHLTVPRHSQLDSIRLVNGNLTVHDVKGELSASCVNGKVTAEGLIKSTRISAVNGDVRLSFHSFNEVQEVQVKSINGRIELAVPPDASADFRANTLSGSINNDFDLFTEKTGFVGKRLEGKLNNGDASVKLSNVNGNITIRRQ